MWVNYGQRVLIKTENDTFGSKLSNDMVPQWSVKWWSCLPIESQGLLCQLQGGRMRAAFLISPFETARPSFSTGLDCATYSSCVIAQLAQDRQSMPMPTNGYSGLKRGNIGSN